MSSLDQLDCLPEDVLAGILSRLPDSRSRLRMEAVSQRMNRLAKRHAWTRIGSFEYRQVDKPKGANLYLDDSEQLEMRTAESESALLRFFCSSDRDVRVQWIIIRFCMLCPEMAPKMAEEAVSNLEIVFKGLERSFSGERKPKVHFAGLFPGFFPSSLAPLLHSVSTQIRGLVLVVNPKILSSETVGVLWKMIEDCQNLEMIGFQLATGPPEEDIEQSMKKALQGKPITRLDVLALESVSVQALIHLLENFSRPLEQWRWTSELEGLLPELLCHPGIFAKLRRLKFLAPSDPLSEAELQQLLCACPSLEVLQFILIQIQDLPGIAALCLQRQQTLKTVEPFQIHIDGLLKQSEETSLTAGDFGSDWDKVEVNEEALEEIRNLGLPSQTENRKFLKTQGRQKTFGLAFCSCFKDKFELTIKSSYYDKKLSF